MAEDDQRKPPKDLWHGIKSLPGFDGVHLAHYYAHFCEKSSISWAFYGLDVSDKLVLVARCMLDIEEKLIVLLRDARKLLSTLCSFDQFANAVVQGACERVFVGELYCDVPLGLYVIRGENLVLIGELHGREKDELPAQMTCVSVIRASVCTAEKAEKEARDLKGSIRKMMEFLDFD
ncbi:sm-like protein LSM1B [Phragmites australis]|uniref:sm-like protein LSM1B n=1 Tax=Phragmites australis TaxID=29695 RepID=UPI002D7855DA|nr:sm-like protein LSM1B [Phragmites australis]